jgi:hypothetical protein
MRVASFAQRLLKNLATGIAGSWLHAVSANGTVPFGLLQSSDL